ncbi:hypothetical protein HPB51_007677 [Rhipicephalus microplus]|uniref:Ig-like domain-containing protein n=1 Tax=Rhipicephalus microplus TaxID=6941 RepID=A0A9J6DT59_RHIMP|nr:hypothetical protein HPB51_007677 [Rhipicephalus microplus]
MRCFFDDRLPGLLHSWVIATISEARLGKAPGFEVQQVVHIGASSVPARGKSLGRPTSFTSPPPRVEFLNGTGAVVPCVAHGSPPPRVTWSTRTGQPLHEVPGLRHMRADGSLVLPPFRAEDFKEDVHSAVYRCLATNSMGTIGSHDVRVRAGELFPNFFLLSIKKAES